MAYLLLAESAGTTRLNHPSLVDHYGADDVPEVELREVDGDERRVIEMTEPLAEQLHEEGVGERVLAHDHFSGDSDAETTDESDDSDDADDADTAADDADEADDADGGGEDEPPDEAADTEDADVADSEAADEDGAE